MDLLANHKSFFHYIKAHKQTFNLTTKLSVLASIANGIRFFKSINLVHMDLNPNNILLGMDLIPKIIDFGEAYS